MKILAVCSENLQLRSKVAQALVEELKYCRYQVVWWRQKVIRDCPGQDLTGYTFWEADDNYSQVYLPGQFTLYDSIPYLSHDFVVAEGDQGAIPQLICAENENDLINLWTPLSLAGVLTKQEIGESRQDQPVFTLSKIKDLVKFLVNAVPERMPFLDANPCCGACGWIDCKAKLADIIKGQADMDDCIVLNSRVEVKIGDQELDMVPFVQELIKKTVTGVLSTLNGYREHCPIEIKIK